MMQLSPMLLLACFLGAAQMARCNDLVKEHDGLAYVTGLAEGTAGLEASAIAVSKWPIDWTTTTKTQTVTKTAAWTTLSTVTMSHSTTKTAHEAHPTLSEGPIHSHGKRTDSQNTWTLLPDGSLSSIGRKAKTTTVTPVVVETIHASSSVSNNRKIIDFTSAAPTTPGPSIIIPSGVSELSVTTIKPTSKTKTVSTKVTITASAKKAVLPIVKVTSTSTEAPAPTSHHDRPDICTAYPPRCHLYEFIRHPFDFISKKWLWLLVVPLILMLATIPMCIWALRQLRRRVSSDNEKTTTAAAPSQVVAADNGRGNTGRTAEEGRGRVAPAADHPAQTVTSAPAGKVTTAPATTTEHVETVPQHDGAASTDNGSPRGRRVPLLMRF